jgi:hypothetical protein
VRGFNTALNGKICANPSGFKSNAAPATVMEKTDNHAIGYLIREGHLKSLLSPDTGLVKVSNRLRWAIRNACKIFNFEMPDAASG